MNYNSVFHFISDITHKEGTSCVIIGGYAVNHYKVARQTADVDILITQEDFQKIEGLLEKAGYKRGLSQANFAHFTSSRLSLMDVDFMFIDRSTLDQILYQAQILTVAGQKFKVPSLNHLIALKLHSLKFNPKLRLPKDLPDIVSLIRINGVNIKDKEFKALCLKFGTPEIYQRLLEVLK